MKETATPDENSMVAVTVESLLSKYGLSSFDLIKMDIEGKFSWHLGLIKQCRCEFYVNWRKTEFSSLQDRGSSVKCQGLCST